MIVCKYMEVFIFWGSYIGGFVSGILLSVLIIVSSKSESRLIGKIKKPFNKKASIVETIDPLDKIDL